MKSTRIIALIFALIMTFSLIACDREGEAETTLPETTVAPEATEEAVDLDLHIVQDGMSVYTAVRPDKAKNYEINALKELRSIIKEKYDVTLDLDTDGKRMPGTELEFQILLGKTNAPESADAIAYIDSIERGKASFIIEAHEKRLVIVASNTSMYDAALKYLSENFMTDAGMTVPIGFRFTADAVPVTPSIYIEKDNELEVNMKELYSVKSVTDANNVKCYIVQGGCTDGEYLYTCLNSGSEATPDASVTSVIKTELRTGEVVARYDGIMVDHANDMTYNSKTKEILICHNKPKNKLISIFDSETMQFKKTVEIKHNIYALEYDEYNDCYWVGISNSYDFVKYDAELKAHGTVQKGYSNGFTKQGVDDDNKYLYFVLYKTNCIAVYTKDGEYVRQIDLPVTKGEPENICHVGDVFYIGYNNPSWTGGIVYEVTITNKK